jgi:tRNA dimethylallyltransferase
MNKSNHKPPVIFLMGPTASGKTDLAIELTKTLPIDIISVDSAMVYKGMDIGTAKPSAEELDLAPHRLIDICDPAESYSVARFCDDALQEIESIVSENRIPLLVGGSVMYFRALIDGLADMPASDPKVRENIIKEAEEKGWPALHQELMAIDPDYGSTLHPNHSQRIARALEVFLVSGQTMTQFRAKQKLKESSTESSQFLDQYHVTQLALFIDDRNTLHQRIECRFKKMMEQGFVDEVQTLRQRSDLNIDLPAIRSVGYRQVWEYLDDIDAKKNASLDLMVEKGMAATRQLAKRQLTWLRSWTNLHKLHVNETTDLALLKKNVLDVLNF